jgi:hypothetical protein
VVELNDIEIDHRWEPPSPQHPHGRSVEITPEERYERVLAWVRELLR